MRSVYAVIYEDGALKYQIEENVDLPPMTDHSVMIQVRACALSPYVHTQILQDVGLAHSRLPVGREVAGIVTQVGSAVTSCKEGDEIVGVVPLDAPCSGCADICVLEEHNIVLKPEKVSFTEAACAVSDGVKAYTALHYLARICAGEIVLIINGADATGTVMIQLALHWGAKVLTTASNEEERTYLEGLRPSPSKVIVVGEKASSLVKSCLEETGGLGVDCIIDNGVSLFESEEDQNLALAVTSQYQPHKHELLSCLGMGGRWVTCQPDLQLDPPDSSLLYLKGASLSFLFTDVWTLASSQQGRFLHILKDVMEKVANKTVRPCFEQPLSLENVPDAYRLTTTHRGRQVMQI
ncbi:quinone oxidoreductase-like protein 1 [Branchiostoma floridae x Branchiostoma belcheri]